MGNSERALKCYEKSLAIAKDHVNKQGITNALHKIGLVCQSIGNSERALKYYEKSLAIAEKLGDKQGITDIYQSIGLVYRDIGEW